MLASAQKPAKPSDPEAFVTAWLDDRMFRTAGLPFPKPAFKKLVDEIQKEFKCSNDRAYLIANNTIQNLNLTKEK